MTRCGLSSRCRWIKPCQKECGSVSRRALRRVAISAVRSGRSGEPPCSQLDMHEMPTPTWLGLGFGLGFGFGLGLGMGLGLG